jgi:hypothetical protein
LTVSRILLLFLKHSILFGRWSASLIIWSSKCRRSVLHHRCAEQESPFLCDACKLFTLSNHPDRLILSAFESIHMAKLITFSDICSHTITSEVKVRLILDQATTAQRGSISTTLRLL